MKNEFGDEYFLRTKRATGLGTKNYQSYISLLGNDISAKICTEVHHGRNARVSLWNHSGFGRNHDQFMRLGTKTFGSYISISLNDINAKICTEVHRGMGNAMINLGNHSSIGRNSRDQGRKFVDLIFHFLGMIYAQKFARKVSVAWGTLGLVSRIIPILIEIHRTRRNYNNS